MLKQVAADEEGRGKDYVEKMKRDVELRVQYGYWTEATELK